MNALRTVIILIILALALKGCSKDEKPVYSGTMTIDNELYGAGPYYGYGFSVLTGRKVSTLDDPLDVITVFEDHDINYNVRKIYFSCRNFRKSFFRYGTYPSATGAEQAFDNLTTFNAPVWEELADTILANQIWLFRTDQDKFAKIRVISTFTERRQDMVFPYAECTFEWVFQPDGSQTFPGK